jgi:excisionase family DNA binding protein
MYNIGKRLNKIRRTKMDRKKLLTIDDVADRYNFKKGSIYNMVNLRRIPFVKIGDALRFDEDELGKWEKHIEPLNLSKTN